MQYVTINQIAAHVGKNRTTVLRGLKIAGIETAQPQGCKGARIPYKDAARWVLRYHPEAGPLPINPQLKAA